MTPARVTPRSAAPLRTGSFRFDGDIGAAIDGISRNRITSTSAWQTIYPETEEAFRARVDDRRTPAGGEWQGEFWGRWILSAVAAYRYQPDDELKEFFRTAARGLISTQDADGYIGTYFDSLRVGPGTWNVWGRKYTLWGLLELYHVLGDDSILTAAVRHANHLMSQIGPGGIPIRETGQFFGLASTSILSPMIGLYRATGDARYLDYALYIVDQWSAEPGAPPDILGKALEGLPVHQWFDAPDTWAKGSELLSCVEGIIDLYEITGDACYLEAARSFHARMVEWERTVVGTISFDDKFTASRFLRNGCGEICEVVYWNRLSHRLLLHTGDASYADEIELSLHNSLLGAMNPEGTWGIRRQRLSHRHIPAHAHCGLEHHQCCVDTLPRALFQAAESALLSDDRGVLVTSFAPGSGRATSPTGQQVAVRIAGDYPLPGSVRISVAIDRPERLSLRLRVPGWCDATPTVTEGGASVPARRDGGWLVIDREWGLQSELVLGLEIEPRVERFDHRRLDVADPLVLAHEERWHRMAFIREGKGKESGLTAADLRPHAPAVAFTLGALTLARDVRLGTPDVFAPVRLPAASNPTPADGGLRIKTITPPSGIRHAFRLSIPGESPVDLCDFSSAGNTWDEASIFTTWLDVDDGAE